LGWDDTTYDSEILASAQGAVFPITEIINPGYVSSVVMLDINYGETTVAPGQLNGQRVTLYRRIYNKNGPYGIGGWGSGGWSERDPGYRRNPWSGSPWSILAWDQYTRTVREWRDPRDYWVKVISETEVELYHDSRFTQPVNPEDFDYDVNDVLFRSEPLIVDQSLVTYVNKLYRCVVSNNDNVFNYDKWELVDSGSDTINAADRVAAFYHPTSNMSGRDIRQLMTGVTYPNATFLGASFEYDSVRWDIPPWDEQTWSGQLESFQYDTDLISPNFTYDSATNPTVYDVSGGTFGEGYGPEELLPGIVTDELDFMVTTAGVDLSFRITVNKAGFGTVYNTNPYTRTVLVRDFVSTDSITDVLYVADASKLVKQTVQTTVTDSSGKMTIFGNARDMTSIKLSVSNLFEFTQSTPTTIELTISGITAPTSITVTCCFGNVVLVNSEYIQFTSIDLDNNTVTGLLRGRKGTITNTFIEAGTTVQSVLDQDRMPIVYWYEWWYGTSGWNVPAWNNGGWNGGSKNQTLYQSTTPAAEFLKRTSS
jgi:hypothetical protein